MDEQPVPIRHDTDARSIAVGEAPLDHLFVIPFSPRIPSPEKTVASIASFFRSQPGVFNSCKIVLAEESVGGREQGEVLQGKAPTAIARYVRERRPNLLVAGRFGAPQT